MADFDIDEFMLKRGVKPTSNRVLVLKELMKRSHPVNMANLEMALVTMDKTSIFRVLELFAEKDIVHTIDDGTRSTKYELCYGGTRHTLTDQHVHFYCERCKETYCLESVRVPIADLPSGFDAHSVNYMFKGLCPKCSDALQVQNNGGRGGVTS